MVLYAALFSPASVSTTLGHCTTAGNGTSTEGKLVVASETVAVWAEILQGEDITVYPKSDPAGTGLEFLAPTVDDFLIGLAIGDPFTVTAGCQ